MSMWLPGIERVEGQSAGAMEGSGGRKLLLHSTEGSTIEGAIAALRAKNVWSTLVVDCRRRRAVQCLPLEVAARSLKNQPGGVQTNKAGLYLVQVEMVGFAATPASLGSPADLDWFGQQIVRPIAAMTGIPLMTHVQWRAYPASYGVNAVQRVPAAQWSGLAGLVGHQHAPENAHGDPGLVDVHRILAAAGAPPAAPPHPHQEDDMAFMVSKPNGATLLVTGNAAVLVTSQQMVQNHKAAGIPGPVACDDNQFGRYEKMRIDTGGVEQTEV